MAVAADAGPLPSAPTADKQRIFVASQWQLMWWRFRKHRLAVVGTVVVILIYLIAIFAEFVAPFTPDAFDADYTYAPPQRLHFFDEDGFGLYTTIRQHDGAVIGRVGILIWNSETWEPTTRAQASGPTEVEVGYTLGRDYWGQGYATEAAGAVRDFALNGLGAERVIALIIHGNTASENVARKLGLEYERDIKLGRRDAQLYALEA